VLDDLFIHVKYLCMSMGLSENGVRAVQKIQSCRYFTKLIKIIWIKNFKLITARHYNNNNKKNHIYIYFSALVYFLLYVSRIFFVLVISIRNSCGLYPTSIEICSSLYSFKRHLKYHLTAQLINN